MEKMDNMQEQVGDVSTKMETLRKNWKKISEIKNTVTKDKGFISRLTLSMLIELWLHEWVTILFLDNTC